MTARGIVRGALLITLVMRPPQAIGPSSATSQLLASPPISRPEWMDSSRNGIVGIPQAVLSGSSTVVKLFIARVSARLTWNTRCPTRRGPYLKSPQSPNH